MAVVVLCFFCCCLRPDTRLRLRSKAWTLFHTHENWILLQWFWKLLSTQKMEKCNVCTAKIHFYACIQAGAERGKTKKKRKPAKEWNVWVWILFFICMKFSHVARWQSIIWASVIFCPFIFANCYYRVFTHSCLAQQMRDAPLNHVCWVIFGSIIRPACGCVWNEECLPWMQFHITIRKILERQTEELNASQGMRSLALRNPPVAVWKAPKWRRSSTIECHNRIRWLDNRKKKLNFNGIDSRCISNV